MYEMMLSPRVMFILKLVDSKLVLEAVFPLPYKFVPFSVTEENLIRALVKGFPIIYEHDKFKWPAQRVHIPALYTVEVEHLGWTNTYVPVLKIGGVIHSNWKYIANALWVKEAEVKMAVSSYINNELVKRVPDVSEILFAKTKKSRGKTVNIYKYGELEIYGKKGLKVNFPHLDADLVHNPVESKSRHMQIINKYKIYYDGEFGLTIDGEDKSFDTQKELKAFLAGEEPLGTQTFVNLVNRLMKGKTKKPKPKKDEEAYEELEVITTWADHFEIPGVYSDPVEGYKAHQVKHPSGLSQENYLRTFNYVKSEGASLGIDKGKFRTLLANCQGE